MNTDIEVKRAPIEKISLNMPVNELGRIDALIEAGITTNRTEFIRNAVRKELGSYEEEIEAIAPRKYFAMGIIHLSEKDVKLALKKGEKLKIRVIGYLRVAANISPDELEEVVHSCRVYGTISAPIPLKRVLLSKKPQYSFLGRNSKYNLLENNEKE